MKTTKRFFIALLSFCLMGIGAVAQTPDYDALEEMAYKEENVVYDVYENGMDRFAVAAPTRSKAPTTYTVLETIKYEGAEVPVTALHDNAFAGKENLSVISLPSTITQIPTSAFSGCTKLEAINLENVTVIGNSAFQGCGKLGTSLDLSNVTSVGDYAFQGCSNLTSLTIGQATIGTSAFSGTAVETLAFADGLTEIPALASQFGGSLKNVYLPSSASVIGVSAFSGCTGLTSIDLTNIEAIGASAFSGCIGLTSVDLSNVTSIGVSAFENCGDIKSKKGLEVVIWPEGLAVFPVSVFSGCAMLHSVSNLNKAKEIGDYAFLNCSLLKGNFEFTNSLQYVGEDAFMGTNFTSVVLKSNPSLNASAFPDAVALNLEIEDKMAFSDDNENTFDKITYVREFSSEKFSTLVLPFVPDQIDQLEVYQLSEQNDNNLIFEEVDVFVPGTPYMVKVKGENVSLSELTGTKQMITKNEQGYIVEAGDWNMIGTYSRLELNASDASEKGRRYYYYTSADGGKFLYATRSLGVSPFRTYIDGPIVDKANNVRMMTRRFDGMETEIDVVELEDVFNPAMGDFYDLKGCRVLAPVEGGVYIVNGKKIVF